MYFYSYLTSRVSFPGVRRQCLWGFFIFQTTQTDEIALMIRTTVVFIVSRKENINAALSSTLPACHEPRHDAGQGNRLSRPLHDMRCAADKLPRKESRQAAGVSCAVRGRSLSTTSFRKHAWPCVITIATQTRHQQHRNNCTPPSAATCSTAHTTHPTRPIDASLPQLTVYAWLISSNFSFASGVSFTSG